MAKVKGIVVGIGVRRNGISKKGVAYDFTPVSFEISHPDFKGYKAFTANVQTSDLNPLVNVGDELNFVYHEDFRTHQIFVDAIF